MQCQACKHLREGGVGRASPVCEAFPGGIPNAIAYHGADHRQARKGDHGVRFAQAEGPEAQQAFENWQSVFGKETVGNQATGG